MLLCFVGSLFPASVQQSLVSWNSLVVARSTPRSTGELVSVQQLALLGENSWFAAFSDFCGGPTLTMADFKPSDIIERRVGETWTKLTVASVGKPP